MYKLEETPNGLIINFEGRLDTASSQDAMAKLGDEIEKMQGKQVVIECSELEYISSSGIRLFLFIRKNVGSTVSLKGVRPEILQILKVTHLDTMFELL